MNRFHFLLAVSVLLIGLNVWRWWPVDVAESLAAGDSGRAPGLAAADFELKLLPEIPAQDARIGRDLFHSEIARGEHDKKLESPVIRVTDFAAQRKAASLAPARDIRVTGVALQRDGRHAFLILDEESRTVRIGDRIDSNYVVESIDEKGVLLANRINNSKKRLLLDGE